MPPETTGSAAQEAAARRFVLQWHVTERCNLRCRHCYQESYRSPELAYPELLTVVEQFKELLHRLRGETARQPLRGHINVTGGEPFVRQDFLDLLGAFAENSQHFTFGILTNGTLIDEAVAECLRSVQPRFVQVSIEGSAPTNDVVRGRGTYDRAVRALRHLTRAQIRTMISFTAHGGNYREFPQVARLARDLGVTRLWADRLIPCGSGTQLDGQLLSPDQTREFFELMYAARREAESSFCNTEISMGRALQFLVGGGTPYRCVAGENLLTVQADGDLVPCRRMPIPVGNVLESSLVELYDTSELLQTLRGHRVSAGCEQCRFVSQCRGGLRCLAFAATGDPFTGDPGCWLATDRVCERAAPAGSDAVGESDRCRAAS